MLGRFSNWNTRGRLGLIASVTVVLTGAIAWVSGTPSTVGFHRASVIETIAPNTTAPKTNTEIQTDARTSAQPTVHAAVASAPAPNLLTAYGVSTQVDADPTPKPGAKRQSAWSDLQSADLLRMQPAQVERFGRILGLDAAAMDYLRSVNAGEAIQATSAVERRVVTGTRLAQLGDIVRTSPAYAKNPDAFARRPLFQLLLRTEMPVPANEARP